MFVSGRDKQASMEFPRNMHFEWRSAKDRDGAKSAKAGDVLSNEPHQFTPQVLYPTSGDMDDYILGEMDLIDVCWVQKEPGPVNWQCRSAIPRQ
jgi:hypothetical protein